MINVADRVVKKVQTHIVLRCMLSNFFFYWQLWHLWDNVVRYCRGGRPQISVWPMRIACWIPKAINTHSEYVILIAFPLQQCLYEHISLCYYMYISCPLYSNTVCSNIVYSNTMYSNIVYSNAVYSNIVVCSCPNVTKALIISFCQRKSVMYQQNTTNEKERIIRNKYMFNNKTWSEVCIMLLLRFSGLLHHLVG
jgi:hypothetical protein